MIWMDSSVDCYPTGEVFFQISARLRTSKFRQIVLQFGTLFDDVPFVFTVETLSTLLTIRLI